MENEIKTYENRLKIEKLYDELAAVRAQIRKLIVGQEELVDMLLTALLADGHVLIEGVPGVAKTLAAKLLAHTVRSDFSRIQFTPDLMPSDILGTSIVNLKESDFVFKKGPVFANMILADEINRAPAKTQAAMFEVMEEKQVTIDGVRYPMETPFMVMATQNPIEQEGTYRLPEAQLDRFLFKIIVGYPELGQEADILRMHHQKTWSNPLELIEPVISADELKHLQQLAAKVEVDDKLLDYIAQIVHATREHPSIYIGASPRASLALMQSAKAWATLQQRDFVIPDDVKRLAPLVLRHRLILMPEMEMEGIPVDQVINQVVESVEIPR